MPFHPLYPFGYGLSYTSFSYSGIRTRQNTDGTVSVGATVSNTGKMKGDEVVQLYVTDMYASVKTRVMELKDFQRITLAPGESKEVSFTLTPYQLSLLNDHMDRVVEPGQFRIMIGGKSPSYTAADRIKNSVGYRSAAEGVNDSLDYTAAYKADFFLTPGSVEEDTVHHQKRVGVTVTNKGNLTDVGTVTMYVDGVQQEEVHHFELGAGQAKQIWFVPEGKGTVDCIFITKYRSATGRYTL
jgi:beta-glucosidase